MNDKELHAPSSGGFCLGLLGWWVQQNQLEQILLLATDAYANSLDYSH